MEKTERIKKLVDVILDQARGKRDDVLYFVQRNDYTEEEVTEAIILVQMAMEEN